MPHLRLEIRPVLMTQDERRNAANALRNALELLKAKTDE
jgi:hypothetical protein